MRFDDERMNFLARGRRNPHFLRRANVDCLFNLLIKIGQALQFCTFRGRPPDFPWLRNGTSRKNQPLAIGRNIKSIQCFYIEDGFDLMRFYVNFIKRYMSFHRCGKINTFRVRRPFEASHPVIKFFGQGRFFLCRPVVKG